MHQLMLTHKRLVFFLAYLVACRVPYVRALIPRRMPTHHHYHLHCLLPARRPAPHIPRRTHTSALLSVALVHTIFFMAST